METHETAMGEQIMLDICTDMDWVKLLHHFIELKIINLQSPEFKDALKISEKLMQQTGPFCKNFIAAT